MENPLRSEAAAYRFLLLTIGFFALIVAATLVFGSRAGLLVFLALSAFILWRLYQGRRELPAPISAAAPHARDERRILVVANDTVGGEALVAEIRRRAEDVDEHVLIVSPLARGMPDEDDSARAAAAERLQRSLVRLRGIGVNAEGEVGDGDPLEAIADALRRFGADEIIISTLPEGRSRWLGRGVVDAARE